MTNQSVPDGIVSRDSVRALEEELFKTISSNTTPALTNLHWLLIKRACHYYAIATLMDDPAADRMVALLLTEPLRVLRSEDSLLRRLESRIVEVLTAALPDQTQRMVVINKLRRTEGRDED